MSTIYDDNQCLENGFSDTECGQAHDIRPGGEDGTAGTGDEVADVGVDDGGVYGGANGEETVPIGSINYMRQLPCGRIDWKALRTLFYRAYRGLDQAWCKINEILAFTNQNNPQPLGDVCGTIERVAVVTENSVKKLVTYSEASAAIASGRFVDTPLVTPDPIYIEYNIPNGFADPNPANLYTFSDAISDDNFGAGTLDDGKLLNQTVARSQFALTCETKVSYAVEFIVPQEATAQEAYVKRSALFVRASNDGGLTWIYHRNIDGNLFPFLDYNALSPTQVTNQVTFPTPLPPGNWVFDLIWTPLSTSDFASMLVTKFDRYPVFIINRAIQ